jgi:hypothetical protein
MTANLKFFNIMAIEIEIKELEKIIAETIRVKNKKSQKYYLAYDSGTHSCQYMEKLYKEVEFWRNAMIAEFFELRNLYEKSGLKYEDYYDRLNAIWSKIE